MLFQQLPDEQEQGDCFRYDECEHELFPTHFNAPFPLFLRSSDFKL